MPKTAGSPPPNQSWLSRLKMGYVPPKPPKPMNAGKPPSGGSNVTPTSVPLNTGWITGVALDCVISASLPAASQNLYYHRFPMCAVCNRLVEKFEQVERFETLDLMFRANCHGRAEEKIVAREALIDNPYVVRDLVAHPWFMADYEKLKAAQLEVKPPPKSWPPTV